MPIPQTAQFERLLESIQLQKPASGGDWIEEILIRENLARDGTQMISVPQIRIWYQAQDGLTLGSLSRKVDSELRNSGHTTNVQVGRIALAAFAYSDIRAGDAVAQFNELFKHVVSADVNQYLLFSLPVPHTYRFSVGPFTIGAFNPQRLEYQSKKAGSDYFERYEQTLRAVPLAIERKPRACKVIDFKELCRRNGPWYHQHKFDLDAFGNLADEYFSEVSAASFGEFFDELFSVQEMGVALGSGWIDPLHLREVIGAYRISVFLNIGDGKWGHVSPMTMSVGTLNLGGAHIGLPATEQALMEHFDFPGFRDDLEIHQTMRSYLHFLALSRVHITAGRQAEAFLHQVIALDLLLGEKKSTTQSVVRRAAALTYLSREKTFTESLRDCDRVYDARSRFVHEGVCPPDSLWPVVSEITRNIAFSLLHLQRDMQNRHPGFREKWVKEVDVVAAKLDAAQVPTDNDLTRIGVAGNLSFGLRDFEALLRGRDGKHPVDDYARH